MIVDPNDKVSILIYAPPSVGKTTLVGTGASDSRIGEIFFLDFEGTTLPVRRLNGVTIKQVRSEQQINETLDMLESTAATNPYRTIVLDTISALHIHVLINLIGKTAT